MDKSWNSINKSLILMNETTDSNLPGGKFGGRSGGKSGLLVRTGPVL